MINRVNILIKGIFLLSLVLLAGSELSCSHRNTRNGDSESNAKKVPAKKQYVCSMHPQVVQDKTGDCPICGMSLIEKVVDANPADTTLNDVVSPVNESVLSSITTVKPVFDNLPLIVEASGIINFDTRKIYMVSARYGGLIERSYIKSQFQRIRKGQAIFQIYCPDIYTEKWNYIKLLQMYPDQDNLTVEAREWLKLLGLTSAQIEALKHSVKPDYHLTVYSDVDGYAVPPDFDPEKYYLSGNGDFTNQTASKGIGLNDGITIQTGTPLFKVVDVRSLRADLKVKTEEVRLLKRGQKVIFSANASPAKRIEAMVSQIEPLNGGVFQLVKVYFTDRDGLLFPGRQIQATIQAGNTHSFWLPETTVFNMGQHKSVFVKHDTKFLATIIKTGIHSGNQVEILSGVDQESKVALNASLLIDSDGLIK